MSKITTLEHLTPQSLEGLISGEIIAIRVKNFCSDETVNTLSDYVKKHAKLDEYAHEVYEDGKVIRNFYGVHRWGTPFNSTYGKAKESPEKLKYYQDAKTMRKLIDNICAPELPPVQKLMEEMNQTWKDGAELAAFDGTPMFSGIIRVMVPETAHLSETTPHVDCLPKELAEFEQQFSANIYIDTPPAGGELVVWDTEAFSFDEVKLFEGDQLPEERLSKPHYLRPEKNELILINTRRPHAICGFEQGQRISMQSFIGYNSNKPFAFWC